MAWRLATSLEVLRAEVNAAHPGRHKASDGTIGDQAHASTGLASDHNPWVIGSDGVGVVRAFDITTDPVIAPDDLAERFRLLGKAGDVRLIGGGYVIYNRRIASERDGWAWRPYSGSDPHTSHIHLSVSRNAGGFDLPAQWGVANTIPPAPPTPTQEDTMEKGMAVDVAFNPAKPAQGATLDRWGGIHPFGGAPAMVCEGAVTGKDIARRLVVTDWAKGTGYVLDLAGALHPVNGAPRIDVAPAYWPNVVPDKVSP